MDILNAVLFEDVKMREDGGVALINPLMGWELPFPVDSLQFHIFLQFRCYSTECDEPRELSCDLVDPDGKPLVPGYTIGIAVANPYDQPLVISSEVIPVGFQGLGLTEPGEYMIVFKIAGDGKGDVKFLLRDIGGRNEWRFQRYG